MTRFPTHLPQFAHYRRITQTSRLVRTEAFPESICVGLREAVSKAQPETKATTRIRPYLIFAPMGKDWAPEPALDYERSVVRGNGSLRKRSLPSGKQPRGLAADL